MKWKTPTLKKKGPRVEIDEDEAMEEEKMANKENEEDVT